MGKVGQVCDARWFAVVGALGRLQIIDRGHVHEAADGDPIFLRVGDHDSRLRDCDAFRMAHLMRLSARQPDDEWSERLATNQFKNGIGVHETLLKE